MTIDGSTTDCQVSAPKHFRSYFVDVISTVGPRGENSQELEKCYKNSLNLLVEKGLRSIVSHTGIFSPVTPDSVKGAK